MGHCTVVHKISEIAGSSLASCERNNWLVLTVCWVLHPPVTINICTVLMVCCRAHGGIYYPVSLLPPPFGRRDQFVKLIAARKSSAG